ncbi:aldehyde dehydrogenase (NADP(+)) [Flammeovirgaceae bacterium SG7u.111]|nr:aldehyde dehydrogenase (NADP(+)) [Flammeovirgaceae bacterium SG7u.111]
MIHGKNRIGFELSGIKTQATDTIQVEGAEFFPATSTDISLAIEKSTKAFSTYKTLSGEKKAAFLDAIADEILALGDELVKTAMAESSLPEGRIVGERGRTMGQLKLFASLLREGSWVDAVIDPALPERQPLPRTDLRKMLVPVGPVVVFTASNFPLAFSTAGGDTASALAAGNPVIVKAHEAHLKTNELGGEAINKAAEKTGMPDGVFSYLVGKSYELGLSLVKHPSVKSVAFTGSQGGGMALYKAAMEREEPIPVFAEMGSINPVVILPNKLASETEALAKTMAGSVTLGVGQFCTNPGLLIALESEALSTFISSLGKEIEQIVPGTMLYQNVANGYQKGKETTLSQKGVKAEGVSSTAPTNDLAGVPTVASVEAADFLANPNLQHEVFGPFSLVVTCKGKEQLEEVVDALKGQLTATIMHAGADLETYGSVVEKAGAKVGRLIFNGVPTGVEVCHAMQHGGPFPASTDSRFTSVGTDAIKRFARPLCFQDCPEDFLPAELKSSNSNSIWRRVNGALTKDTIA